MANFLSGFAQGFTPAYERTLSRRERLDDIQAAQTRQDQLLSDQIAREDARQTILDDRYKAEQTETKRRWDEEQKAKMAKIAFDKAVAARLKEEKMEDIRANLTATDPSVQEEAYKGVGGVPMRGLREGTEAMTLRPTPEELKGLPRGKAVQAQMRAEAGQKKADEIEKEKRDREAEGQSGKDELALDIQNLFGQLGDKNVPIPTPEALGTFELGDLQKLKGDLERRLEERKSGQRTSGDQAIWDSLKATNPEATSKQLHELFLQQKASGKMEKIYDREGNLIYSRGTAPTGGTDKRIKTEELDSALINLKELKEGYRSDKPQVGWIASVKSAVGDKGLTQFGFEGWADADRVKYRNAVGQFRENFIKAMNKPDIRISDMDRKALAPLAPGLNDSPFVFRNKIDQINTKLRKHIAFNAAMNNEKDVWSMSLRDVLDANKKDPKIGQQLNDHLAAFALKENHGLRGRGDREFVRDVSKMVEKEILSEDEMRLYINAVLGR